MLPLPEWPEMNHAVIVGGVQCRRCGETLSPRAFFPSELPPHGQRRCCRCTRMARRRRHPGRKPWARYVDEVAS